MDDELVAAIENGTLGWAVLYGEREREDFWIEDGWTFEQVVNFSDSVEGIVCNIVGIKTISNEEIFGE